MRRQAAADIQQFEIEARARAGMEDASGRLDGERPFMRLRLLRADMERHADGAQPVLPCVQQQLRRHLGRAAELAAERPLRALVLHQQAAENARARCATRELVELRFAVEREKIDARLRRARNVGFPFHGVAE